MFGAFGGNGRGGNHYQPLNFAVLAFVASSRSGYPLLYFTGHMLEKYKDKIEYERVGPVSLRTLKNNTAQSSLRTSLSMPRNSGKRIKLEI